MFEAGQHPIIVGQAAYNSAYGSNFAASGNCSRSQRHEQVRRLPRIDQYGGKPFRFDTLDGNQLKVHVEPKAMHDEMNSTTFDEFGRMRPTSGSRRPRRRPG